MNVVRQCDKLALHLQFLRGNEFNLDFHCKTPTFAAIWLSFQSMALFVAKKSATVNDLFFSPFFVVTNLHNGTSCHVHKTWLPSTAAHIYPSHIYSLKSPSWCLTWLLTRVTTPAISAQDYNLGHYQSQTLNSDCTQYFLSKESVRTTRFNWGRLHSFTILMSHIIAGDKSRSCEWTFREIESHHCFSCTGISKKHL